MSFNESINFIGPQPFGEHPSLRLAALNEGVKPSKITPIDITDYGITVASVENTLINKSTTNQTPGTNILTEATKQAVIIFLRDRLDLITLVKNGGTTGDYALDSVIKGVISAATEQAADQNKKYAYWIIVVFAILLIWRKFR